MGVPGLYTFFASNPHLFKKFELRDTKIIVDGLNLCYQLYLRKDLDFAYGGDYDKFAELIKVYFANMKECNLIPIVILDGARDVSERKIATIRKDIIKRLKSFHNVSKYGVIKEHYLPLLAIDVFKQVMNELGIVHSQSDYEADEQIAALAKLLGCPVVSNDSDFLIYDIPGGVIRLDAMDCDVSQKENYSYIDCDIYNVEGFLSNFPQLNREVLPLVGTLLGNDYIDAKIFHNFFDNIKLPKKRIKSLNTSKNQLQIVTLFQWLENKTVETAIVSVLPYLKKEKRDHVEALIRSVMDGYIHCFSQMEDYLTGQSCLVKHSRLGNNGTTPNWFLEDFHSCHLSRFEANILVSQKAFLLSQAEEQHKPSAHDCSLKIRKAIYSILLCSKANSSATVSEYDRKESNLKMKEVEVTNMLQAPDFETLPDYPLQQKRTFLLDLLSCRYSWLSKFPPTWQLLVACLQFVVQNGTPPVTREFLSAVLLSCLLLSFDDMYADSQALCLYITPEEMKVARHNTNKYFRKPKHNYAKVFLTRVVHCFSQLQSCLLYVTCLNRLLQTPLPDVQAHVLLNGSFIYAMTCNLEGRPNISLFISEALGRQSNLDKFFSDLDKRLMKGVDSEKLACIKNKTKTKREKKVKSKSNVFSVLELDDCS